MMKTKMTMTIGLLVAVAGCRPILDPDKHATEEEELGSASTFVSPERESVRGTYEVTTTFDLTAASVAPAPANEALTTLTQLRDDPAGLMFDLLDAAGVPLVEELRNALPGFVEDQLEDWIDAALAGAGIAGEIDFILARSQTVLTSVDLVTILDMPPPDERGFAVAKHMVTELHWQPVDGADTSVPLGDTIGTSVEVWVDSDGDRTEMVFGEQGFGLPYGDYAWEALEAQVKERTGRDIRDQLSVVADCAGMAASVADQCILGQCVGHEAELTEICEMGLDAAVDLIEEQVSSYRFDAVSLHSGAAAVTPAGFPKGIWDAEIDAGMGARPVPARFTATRL